MQLQLSRSIVFFDLETTGLDFQRDRIIEISMLKVYPNGSEETYTQRINPGISIPASSTAIHGITNSDVANSPSFKTIAPKVISILQNSDIAGYNSNRFDVPMLAEELIRAQHPFDFNDVNFVDVQTIFHKMERRTLEAAYLFYCNKQLNDAHSAEADTLATYEILKAQLERYPDVLKNDIKFLSKFTMIEKKLDLAGRILLNAKNEPVFNFGKHKGQSVVDIFATNPGYYSWIMDNDFPEESKRHFSQIFLQATGKAK